MLDLNFVFINFKAKSIHHYQFCKRTRRSRDLASTQFYPSKRSPSMNSTHQRWGALWCYERTWSVRRCPVEIRVWCCAAWPCMNQLYPWLELRWCLQEKINTPTTISLQSHYNLNTIWQILNRQWSRQRAQDRICNALDSEYKTAMRKSRISKYIKIRLMNQYFDHVFNLI